MSNEKLVIKDILAALDLRAKEVWDEFTPEQQKQVSFWLLNRYLSSVSGPLRDQATALLLTNEFYNKNWNVLGARHPKLQWQLMCLINEDEKLKFHKWIGLKRKGDSSSKAVKFLIGIYPDLKIDEVEILAKMYTKSELKDLAKDHGIDPKSIDV